MNWTLVMQTKRVLVPTVLLSMLLTGFCVYMALKPADGRARADVPKSLSVAYVSFVEGDVTAKTKKEPKRGLKKGYSVFPGDVLQTGLDGRLELVLRAPHGRLRLDRETTFNIQGEVQGARVVATGGLVARGSVWAGLSPKRKLKNPFVLDTETLRASATGAVFRVEAHDQNLVRVFVYDGTVATGSSDENEWLGSREISAGQALKVLPGQAPVVEKIDLREDWSDGWGPHRKANAPVVFEMRPEEKQISRSLIKDLRSINPDLYMSVEVEIQGLESQKKRFLAESAQIRKLKIRARTWDDLQASHKVRVLNETFDRLKQRYPNMMHSVVLEFDDGRPDLALQYALKMNG